MNQMMYFYFMHNVMRYVVMVKRNLIVNIALIMPAIIWYIIVSFHVVRDVRSS